MNAPPTPSRNSLDSHIKDRIKRGLVDAGDRLRCVPLLLETMNLRDVDYRDTELLTCLRRWLHQLDKPARRRRSK